MKKDAYVLTGIKISQLTESFLAQYNAGLSYHGGIFSIIPVSLEVNEGVFGSQLVNIAFPEVRIVQQVDGLVVACTCNQSNHKLCEHGMQVLSFILKRDDIKLFFDTQLRQQKLKRYASEYGLENEPDLDLYFKVNYQDKQLEVTPRLSSLVSATPQSLKAIGEWLFADDALLLQSAEKGYEDIHRCIVLREHKYYKNLVIELYDSLTTREGKIKNPLATVDPLAIVNESNDAASVKFLTAVTYFQQSMNSKKSVSALNHLKSVINNPLDYPFYYHNASVSEKVNASSVVPVQVHRIIENISLTVRLQGQFFEVTGGLKIGDTLYALKDMLIRFTYFIELNDAFYLVKDLQMLGLIQLFKQKGSLLIHESQFKHFRTQVLNKLENRISVTYKYIKEAGQSLVSKQQIYENAERIIYLSDFGQHVMIVPIMRYDEIEIPVRTQKQIYTVDKKGNEFLVKRDEQAELAFLALLIKQHPYFEEQLNDDLQYFYLHKKYFLDESWFLNSFDEWHNQNITILGFNELSGNKLNQHKVKITIQVLSGIDWFNTKVNVRFGRKKASLKHLHKAVRNRSKYVQLDDGTLGILPQEWIDRFARYFEAGEVLDEETIVTPKINYASLSEVYDPGMLAPEVEQEIENYNQRFVALQTDNNVEIPVGLNATLRTYQHQGLKWLNFLDDMNFGGCLADDMGLGKTVQIIAFVLLQRTKVKEANTNLLVVPTTLIFNWQAEIQKFAPSIKVHTVYGTDRIKAIADFDKYEVILTSYGTLLSDVGYLKHYIFNYVFLDESQNIKNPESQRYKAACQLQSRNKIAITGTPIENNTFDLFSQLSFACPGLLGSKQYFKDIYSSPIDKFKVSKRTRELQERVRPFLLRRTKQEVADELPDKTETVLYCEMQAEQRKIYNAYEKEFREFISATSQDELPRASMYVLKGLTRLRQICDSPAIIKGEKLPGDSSAKIDVLLEQIEYRAPQHKILVFSQFVSMLDLVKKELTARNIGYAYLTGSTRNREAVVNDFQTNPDTRVFLISLKAGGAGLNLTAADYVYLVDPWWNPAVENQAIDRCYRIGQHKNVVAVRLICPGTIEDKVQKLQEYKKELVDKLVKNSNSVLNILSKDDILGLLGATKS